MMLVFPDYQRFESLGCKARYEEESKATKCRDGSTLPSNNSICPVSRKKHAGTNVQETVKQNTYLQD